MNLCRTLLVIAALLAPAATARADGAMLGANKLDLFMQYLGTASNGDGGDAYRRVTTDLAHKAIRDAATLGLPFLRVAISGYAPQVPSQLAAGHNDLALWQQQPKLFWHSMDTMMADLAAHHLQIVPVFMFDLTQFAVLGHTTLGALIRDTPNPGATLMARFIADFIGRYRSQGTIAFYELTNELNADADLDLPQHCPAGWSPSDCAVMTRFYTADMDAFAQRMVTLIHSLDPTRLVSSGYTAPRGSAWHLQRYPEPSQLAWTPDTEHEYQRNLAEVSAPFDIVSIHDYRVKQPEWQWLRHGTAGLVDASSAVAGRLGKPLYVGEFGDRSDTSWLREMVARLQAGEAAYASFWALEFYQANPYTVQKDPGVAIVVPEVAKQAPYISELETVNPPPRVHQAPPSVVIQWPLPCAAVGTRVRVHVAAYGPGGIASVDVSVNGVPQAHLTAAPFTATLKLPASGLAQITATATNGVGQASYVTPVLAGGSGACTVPPP